MSNNKKGSNQFKLVRKSDWKRKVKKLIMWVLSLAVIFVVMIAVIRVKFPQIEVKTVEVKVAVETIPPVLQRIAGCESEGNPKSKGSQLAKSGQVRLNANKNGTVDVGKYQVNSIWFAQATKLGYDLTVEKDNEAMAQWIYNNRGTGDWYSSQACWK